MADLHSFRKEYQLRSLDEKDVHPDAMVQFHQWFQEAINSEIIEPNAMALATCSKEGIPSNRMVLLKEYHVEGFTFFTNYNSQKGKELLENPHASLLFFWKELERQIRITGNVEKIKPALSDQYFNNRPVKSRIGAWASPQSHAIPNREYLEKLQLDFMQLFDGTKLQRPEYWGGYIVKPSKIEFWQGRESRLHDRIVYSRMENNWRIERLAP